jgi:hypothetical protein
MIVGLYARGAGCEIQASDRSDVESDIRDLTGLIDTELEDS